MSAFTHRIHLHARQKLYLDIIILLFLGVVLAYLLVAVPLSNAARLANIVDHAWYLNRAHLFQRGIFDDIFVYNSFYPLLIGTVDLFAHDLAQAGILANWIAVLGLVLGTYLLGRVFYNRQIAFVAVLFLVTNLAFQAKAKTLWPYLLFQAALVGCVLSYWLLIRYRNIFTAVLMGLMLVVALYTRLEGVCYYLLAPLAVWSIYRATGRWRLSVRLGVITTAIFAAGLGFYLYILLGNSDVSNGRTFEILHLFGHYPIIWGDVSHRWMETLEFMADTWPLWAWAIALAGAIWTLPRFRSANLLFAGLVLLNIAYIFGISIWPTRHIAANSLAFVALLLASGLWSLTKHRRFGRLIMSVVILSVVLPGGGELRRLFITKAHDYHQSAMYHTVQKIDTWLETNGWQGTEIFTFCAKVIPFTSSNFHYLYRQNKKDINDPTVWWNSPDNLLPHIRDQGQLFMRCSQDGWYSDWLDYFADPIGHPQRLVEINRIDDEFVFYKVVDATAHGS